MTDAPQDRIVDLEIALAHQTHALEEMSAEMARQGAVIERLERGLKALAERFLALEESAAPRAEATRPPHY